MAKRRKSRKKIKSRVKRWLCGAVLGAAAVFLVAFHTDEVEIVGNSYFTEGEIKKLVLNRPLSFNTVLLTTFQREIPTNSPLLQSVSLERMSRKKIRVRVEEKQLIGYVIEDETKLYFDKDGMVLQAVKIKKTEPKKDNEQVTPTAEVSPTAEATPTAEVSPTAEATPTPTAEVSPTPTAEASPTAEATVVPETLTPEPIGEKKPEKQEQPKDEERVPLVQGLEYQSAGLNHKLEVEQSGIFNTIQGIVKIADKYEIMPERIVIREDEMLALQYGGIEVLIGRDEYLEEKVARVAAILPKLEPERGTLHLEDYTKNSRNIIFSQAPMGDGSEDSKKPILSLVGMDGTLLEM